jgi:hypothetical protein
LLTTPFDMPSAAEVVARDACQLPRAGWIMEVAADAAAEEGVAFLCELKKAFQRTQEVFL